MKFSLTFLLSFSLFSFAVSAGQLEDALIAAIKMNEFERAIQIFAENDIDPDFKILEVEFGASYPGQTILGIAVDMGHWELVGQMLKRKPDPDLPEGAKETSSAKKREREEEEHIDNANVAADPEIWRLNRGTETLAAFAGPEEMEPNAEDVPNDNTGWAYHWHRLPQNRGSTDDDFTRRGAAVIPPLFDDPEIAALFQNPVVAVAENNVANERVPQERDLNPRAGFYFDGPRGLGGFFGGGSLL